VHTMSDGDTLFALATGMSGGLDFNVLCTMAGEAVARACVNAVRAAQGVAIDTLLLPSAADLTVRGTHTPARTQKGAVSR